MGRSKEGGKVPQAILFKIRFTVICQECPASGAVFTAWFNLLAKKQIVMVESASAALTIADAAFVGVFWRAMICCNSHR